MAAHIIDSKTLVTINLKYSSSAEPLRTLAFAQLAAKVIYAAAKPISVAEVRDDCAVMLGINHVARQSVVRGLEYLKEVGHAEDRNERWSLTQRASGQIQRSVQESATRLDGVLQRHFPTDLVGGTLRSWFSEASALVFGRYGDEWVANLSRNSRISPPRFEPLTSLLEPLTRDHGLTQRLGPLVEGYLAFLGSQIPEDQQMLMNLAQAMFSARLVTADVGADPLTLDEFRSATVILDTNVLFAIALEDHRLAKSIGALGAALKAMAINVVYIRPSRDEYIRTLGYKRDQILKAVSTFSEEVLSGVRDDFLATARARGCSDEESFGRFFDTLTDLPEEIQGGSRVVLFEDEKIQAAIDAAGEDARLKDQLVGLSKQFRPKWRRPKGEPSAAHDAALLFCAEQERERGNCWVLSLDRSLTACAVQRAGPHSLPVVLSADALIEILSLNGAGPGVTADDFAPLLSRIILNQCEPQTGTYTLEDLHLLASINEAATQLKPEETRELARYVARERVAGKTAEDANLRLEVNRRFQRTQQMSDDVLREAQQRAQRAEQEAASQRERSVQLRSEVERERSGRVKAEARWMLARTLLWRIPVALGVTCALFVLGRVIARDTNLEAVSSFGLSAAGFLGAVWKLVWKAVIVYRSTIQKPV